MDSALYSFGGFELDCGLYALRKDGESLKLTPKAFDLLRYLLEHRERVVPKSELLDRVWPDEIVSEAVLPTHVTALRKALGDGRSAPRVIQTVHGRGYRFIAEVAERLSAAPPTDAADRPRFVGRAGALEKLRHHVVEALAGRGRIALLAGEPGIGKTRTTEEICRYAGERGAAVFDGRCFEGEGAPAFWPWLQILRSATANDDPDELREQLGVGASDIAHLVPELRERLPDVPIADELDSEEARFRLFDSVARFLRNRSRTTPLVLVLDDLHWADEPTLRLLEFCAEQLHSASVLILGAYRDVELRRGHPLAQMLGELARAPSFDRILLRGLAEEEVAEFLTGALGRVPGERLVDAVFEMTEGNPFFIHETARLLLAEEDAAGRELGTREIALPQGAREAIGRRLTALSPECNRVLTLAAVVGSVFSLAVLETLSGLSAERLLEVLEEAVEARIIGDQRSGGRSHELPLGHYSFSHVLVKETLYSELTAPEKTPLHLQVAQALEVLHVGSGEALAEIAHHYFEAAPGGNVARAIEASVQAAEHALALLAYEDSAAHYARALQVAELGAAPETRFRILLGAGLALRRFGREETARQHYQSAAAIGRRLKRADLLAEAALGMGGWPPVSGAEATLVNPEFRTLVEEAVAMPGPCDDGLRARLKAALAVTPPDQDSMARREELSLASLDLARKSGDSAAYYDALMARMWALQGPDDGPARMEVANDLLARATRDRTRSRIFAAREERVRSLMEFGEFAAMDHELTKMEAIAEELRLFRPWSSAHRFRITRAIGSGRLDEAMARIDELEEREPKPIDEASLTGIAVLRGLTLFERGEFGSLFELADELFESASWAGPGLRTAIAYFSAESGERERGRGLLEGAKDLIRLRRDEDWLITMHFAGLACAALGDPRAANVYEQLVPYAKRNVTQQRVRIYVGSASLSLGCLAEALGRTEEAHEHFRAAVAHNSALGTRPALARSHEAWSRLLAAEGATNRAQEERESATSIAAEVGMAGLLRRTRHEAG